MRKVPTRKQILDSGWNDFLNFVLREKLTPNNLHKAMSDWELELTLLKLIGDVERGFYPNTGFTRKLKMQGLDAFLRMRGRK